jgi:hypothetical protein
MKFSNVFLFALASAQEGEEGDERWGGSVGGDPHFVIEGPNMERLCFDYTPTVDHDITLLSDPTSALSVTGTPSKRIDGKIVLTNIHFKSPGGAMLEFDHDGFKMPSDEDVISVKYGHIKYHDVTLYDNWEGNHAKTRLEIANGPSFIIKEKMNKGALTFHVIDSNGLSDECRGMIGGFFHSDSYFVKKSGEMNELGQQMGTVTIGDATVPAVEDHWHHLHAGEKCWIIEEEDIAALLEQF